MGIITLLVLWELGSRVFGSNLIFPGPLPVLQRFISLVPTERFFRALLYTFGRVLLGMVVSVPLSVLVGIAAGVDKRGGAFFRPLYAVIAATPVMSVILIVFLMLGQERTPVFTAFLMVFPVMTVNTIEGVRSVDTRIQELFRIYPVSPGEKLRYVYIPAVMPFILGGLRSSLSLCWKVVVAAEVLVQPVRALGTGMQMAKAQFETPELFAWTVATIAAAALSQGLLTLILSRYKKRRP
ncbi:MAG: ABC transporter permease subunit [Treponema sp.]|nr:ABC transporter permease subunit [Treponema sp.]